MIDSDAENVRNPKSVPSKRKSFLSHRVTTYAGHGRGSLTNRGLTHRPNTAAMQGFKPDQASLIRPVSVSKRIKGDYFTNLQESRRFNPHVSMVNQETPSTAKWHSFKLNSSQRTKMNSHQYKVNSSLFGGHKVREVTFEDEEKSHMHSDMDRTLKTEENLTVGDRSAEKDCRDCKRESIGSNNHDEERRSMIKSRCANPKCNDSLSRKTQDSRRSSQKSKRNSSLDNKNIDEKSRRSVQCSKHSNQEDRKSAQVSPRASTRSIKIQTEMSIKSARDACCHTVCVQCEINKSMKLLPPRSNSSGKKSKQAEINPTEDGNINTQKVEILSYNNDEFQPLNKEEQEPLLTLISDGTVEAIPQAEPIPPVAPLYSDIDQMNLARIARLEKLNLTISFSHPSLSLKVNMQSAEAIPRNRPSPRTQFNFEVADEANLPDKPSLASDDIKRLAFISRVNFKVIEYEGQTAAIECTMGQLYRQIEDRSYRSIDKMKLTSSPKYPDSKELIYCLSRTIVGLIEQSGLARRRDEECADASSLMKQSLFVDNRGNRVNEQGLNDRSKQRQLPNIPRLPMELLKLDQSDYSKIQKKSRDNLDENLSERSFGLTGISDAGNERTMREAIERKSAKVAKKKETQLRSPPSKKSPKQLKPKVIDQRITSEMLQDWKKGLEIINQKAILEVGANYKGQNDKEHSAQLGLSLLQTGKKLIEKEMKELRNRTKFDFAFEEKTIQSDENPSLESIIDFITNIVMSCKIIRQGIVVSLIYIERLLIGAMTSLTARNWKNMILTSLVLSSKIWDDESFENHNFARALPTFETQRIDAMEKMFLEAIDYNVYVEKYDYTRYYFHLKRFERYARQAEKTNNLNPKTFYQISDIAHHKEKQSQVNILSKNKISRNKSIDVIV